MGSLGVVLADVVLILVALGGGIFTLVRARRVGGLAVGLAGTACGLLVVSAIVDMVWWLAIFPGLVDEADSYSDVAALNGVTSLITWIMTVVSIGLLFASTNVGRSAAAGQVSAAAAQQGFGVPGGAPHHGALGGVPAPVAQPTQPAQAQPAQGWTPPQQAQPDWNIHSGVWSIPRGTFDGPPPDQRQH